MAFWLAQIINTRSSTTARLIINNAMADFFLSLHTTAHVKVLPIVPDKSKIQFTKVLENKLKARHVSVIALPDLGDSAFDNDSFDNDMKTLFVKLSIPSVERYVS
jgi:hypothetical protein